MIRKKDEEPINEEPINKEPNEFFLLFLNCLYMYNLRVTYMDQLSVDYKNRALLERGVLEGRIIASIGWFLYEKIINKLKNNNVYLKDIDSEVLPSYKTLQSFVYEEESEYCTPYRGIIADKYDNDLYGIHPYNTIINNTFSEIEKVLLSSGNLLSIDDMEKLNSIMNKWCSVIKGIFIYVKDIFMITDDEMKKVNQWIDNSLKKKKIDDITKENIGGGGIGENAN